MGATNLTAPQQPTCGSRTSRAKPRERSSAPSPAPKKTTSTTQGGGGDSMGLTLTINILAGGRSSRMGKDKSRLRLGRRSLIRHISDTASQLGHPVRVIRRDLDIGLGRGCGPLAGIYTGLKTNRADAGLFLACDMPFISPALLRRLIRQFNAKCAAVFTVVDGRLGFPLLLRRTAVLPVVHDQLRQGSFSLRTLAKLLHAKRLEVSSRQKLEVTNINTPEDLEKAVRRYEV